MLRTFEARRLVVLLRRAYIVEEALPFPEGLACAEVLRTGESAASAAPLLWGGIISAALKAAQDLLGVIPGTLGFARFVGDAAVSGSINVSAALLGVGYIVGIRIAALVFAGGAFAWLVAIPLATMSHHDRSALDAATAASQVWRAQVRYLGVGAMLVGGIVTLWRLRVRIGAAISDSLAAIRERHAAVTAREDTDLPAPIVVAAVALCAPVIFAISLALGASLALSLILAVALIVIAFFATAIAGYLTGIVGASNNPVSGVTVIVLLAVALVLQVMGVAREVGPTLAISVGAIVCTAAAMAGDSLHDLATGHYVGATPRNLEIGVLTGAIASSFLMAPILNLLISGYGIAGTVTAKNAALSAPQAFLMAKVAQGVFTGGLPWLTISAGAALAAALAIADRQLERRGATWRTPIMPVALGLYLPFGLSVAIALGALVRELVAPKQPGEAGSGLLFAAGLVAGEALMGVASGALVTVGISLPLMR